MSLLTRDVDYFLAICESRSIGRAAQSLGVSQPTLTRSLQQFEARFGARLFHRTPKGVESNSWDALLDAVAATDLYTMGPTHGTLLHSWASKLESVSVAGLDITYRTGIVTRAEAYLSPLAERAIELIRESVGQEIRNRSAPGSGRKARARGQLAGA